jgi:hypothetical protein
LLRRVANILGFSIDGVHYAYDARFGFLRRFENICP